MSRRILAGLVGVLNRGGTGGRMDRGGDYKAYPKFIHGVVVSASGMARRGLVVSLGSLVGLFCVHAGMARVAWFSLAVPFPGYVGSRSSHGVE